MINFKLDIGAVLPFYGSEGAAGLDICNNGGDITIQPLERALISTGVHLQGITDDNIYLRVAPRSKLANKLGLNVLAGVVDEDYRGEIMVIIHNTGNTEVTLHQGQAIAQLIPELTIRQEVIEGTLWDATARGTAGINNA